MKLVNALWLSFVLFLALSCTGCSRSTRDLQPFDSPAPAHSAEVNLRAHGERLYLSWLLHHDDSHEFQYAVWEDGNWSDVRTIYQGNAFFANWADVPSVTELADGSLLAHWLWKSADDTYAYDVMLSHSSDGRTWSEPQRPHDDGTPTEHGFVSLLPLDGDEAMVVWLDGRNFAGKEHDEAEMTVRAARYASGKLTSEALLDSRACDCCPTATVRLGDEVLVAYRDRSDTEVRDVSLVRFVGDTWSAPVRLAEDNWKIPGCPVNGPRLDSREVDGGHQVVAAWFTMRDTQPQVRLAFSANGGDTWSESVRVDDGIPLGRTDVCLLPSGQALVIWLETPETGDAQIRGRRVLDDGTMSDSFLITETSGDRASGFPRLQRMGSRLYFAWTVPADPSAIAMASMDVSALP